MIHALAATARGVPTPCRPDPRIFTGAFSMTPQEKELLERFLADLTAARAGQKDPEAEALIRDAVSRQPDAAYLLVQRALQLDHVLQMRESEVQKLQNELAQARAGASAGSGGGFFSDPYAWGAQPRSAAPPGASSQQPVALPATGAQQPASVPAAGVQAQAAQRPGGWGGSSMLGTVAGTAAGVVGGAFLFQGIQNLMHRNDPPAASPDHHAADHHAQPLIGDSTGFEDVVPDDSDSLAAGDDDTDNA
jgi:hypothetical protein